MKLIYVGNGAAIPDIPARDLSGDEVKKHGGEIWLVATGLYQRPNANKPRKRGNNNGRN